MITRFVQEVDCSCPKTLIFLPYYFLFYPLKLWRGAEKFFGIVENLVHIWLAKDGELSLLAQILHDDNEFTNVHAMVCINVKRREEQIQISQISLRFHHVP